MATGKFVTYLRVSTARQGESGLGLEAQRAAVQGYLNGGHWSVVEELVEIESGKNIDRPQLAKAMRLCRLHGATLLIAKIDRLARNVHFISGLMESGVEFVAADMPVANKLTVHIMAAMAEYEAKAISDRTKLALSAAKARGKVLGGRRVSAERFAEISAEGRVIGNAVRSEKARERAGLCLEVIKDIEEKGVTTLLGIAGELNKRGIKTARGGVWSAVQVSRVMAYAG